HHTHPTEIHTLSLHDALPIYLHGLIQITNSCADSPNLQLGTQRNKISQSQFDHDASLATQQFMPFIHSHKCQGFEHTPMIFLRRSEEHTSELQSRENLVCRLL